MVYKDLKITRLELLMVKPRFMFLKMHTNQDIVGYGEPILEGQTHAVAGAVRAMENYLLGKDPRQIEHHWQALYKGSFYRGGPILTSALSGIEQALWDILGKSLGVPVYQLLVERYGIEFAFMPVLTELTRSNSASGPVNWSTWASTC